MTYILPDGDNIQVDFVDVSGSYSYPHRLNIIANFEYDSDDIQELLPNSFKGWQTNLWMLCSCGAPKIKVQVPEVILWTDVTTVRGKPGYRAACPEVLLTAVPAVTKAMVQTAEVFVKETILLFNFDYPDPELRIEMDSILPGFSSITGATEISVTPSIASVFCNFKCVCPEIEVSITSSLYMTHVTTNSYSQLPIMMTVPTSIANSYGEDRFGTGVAMSGNGKFYVVGTPLWEYNAEYSSEGRVDLFKQFDGIWKSFNSFDGNTKYGVVGYSVAYNYDGTILCYTQRGEGRLLLFKFTSDGTYITSRYINYDLWNIKIYSVAVNGAGDKVIIGTQVGFKYCSISFTTHPYIFQIGETFTFTRPGTSPQYYQVAMNTSGTIFTAASGQYIHTFDLIDGVWKEREAVLPSEFAGSTCMCLVCDGSVLILSGTYIYDWREYSWILRGSKLVVDYDSTLIGSLGVGCNEEGTYMPVGCPTFDYPYANTGANFYWSSPDIRTNVPTISLTLETSIAALQGNLISSEDMNSNLYVNPTLDAIRIFIPVSIPETILTTSCDFLFKESDNNPYIYRDEVVNEAINEVSLSANGKVLVLSKSDSVSIYDYSYLTKVWTVRHEPLPFVNPIAEINENGNTLVVSEPSLGQIRTFFWNGVSWYLLDTLSVDGQSLCIRDTVLAVGDSSFNNKGKVEIYSWISGHWILRNTLYGSTNGERFGMSVALAINGSMLSVASKMDDLYATRPNIYTYDFNGEEWIQRGIPFSIDEHSVHNLSNVYRHDYGVTSDLFRRNVCLSNAANDFAEKLANMNPLPVHLPHIEEDGTTPYNRIVAAHYYDNFDHSTYKSFMEVLNTSIMPFCTSEITVESWKHSKLGHAEGLRGEIVDAIENGVGICLTPDGVNLICVQKMGKRIDGFNKYYAGEVDVKHTVSISLSLDGKRLVVGSTEYDNKKNYSGGVQTFVALGDTWGNFKTSTSIIDSLFHTQYCPYSDIWMSRDYSLLSPNEIRNGFFGSSIAVNGTARIMAVAAKGENKVYIYTAIPELYKVGGVIKQGYEGIAAKTRVMNVATGRITGEIMSNSDGVFEITELKEEVQSSVIFHNPLQGTKQDAISRVLPVRYEEE